jgi:hypothetical protein
MSQGNFMNFESVFELLLTQFKKYQINFALIGGFAMHVAGYTRATGDIDFLAAKEDMPKVKKIMLAYGYQPIHESEDVTNFSGTMAALGQVDFLHAHRKYARRMLETAKEADILNGKFRMKVLCVEDLIGLKVQSSSNDSTRYHQDMSDIEFLMKANSKNLDIPKIREYFRLFDREMELDKILKEAQSC